MKKSITMIALLCAGLVNAEEIREMRVACDKTESIMNVLREKYQELPIVAGKSLSTKSTISVWGNPLTNTFTILDTRGDMTCVLSVGTDFTVLLQGKDV